MVCTDVIVFDNVFDFLCSIINFVVRCQRLVYVAALLDKQSPKDA